MSHLSQLGLWHNLVMEKDTAKIVMPKALKRLFKATCTQRDTEMSAVMTQLAEQWCIENNRSVTIAQLIEENRSALQTANLSDIDAIAAGSKPSKADLVKLATALGVRAEFLQAICDRTFNGESKEGVHARC
jgi:hypothetical protein